MNSHTHTHLRSPHTQNIPSNRLLGKKLQEIPGGSSHDAVDSRDKTDQIPRTRAAALYNYSALAISALLCNRIRCRIRVM